MVHEQSVVSTRIKNFNELLYNKLTNMEKYTYTKYENNSNMLSAYKGVWSKYSTAWVNYLDVITMDEGDAKDFILQLYGFVIVHVQYGRGDPSILYESDAANHFGGDGLLKEIPNRSNDYFHDIVFPPMGIDGIQDPPYSPRMDADESRLESAGEGDLEALEELADKKYTKVIRDFAYETCFGPTEEPLVILDKGQMWDIIFVELHWGDVFRALELDESLIERCDTCDLYQVSLEDN